MTHFAIKYMCLLFVFNAFLGTLFAQKQALNNPDCQGRACFEVQTGVSFDFSYIDEQNKRFFEAYAPLLDEEAKYKRLLGDPNVDEHFMFMGGHIDSYFSSLCNNFSKELVHRLNNELGGAVYFFCGSKLVRILPREFKFLAMDQLLSSQKNVVLDLQDFFTNEPLERLKAERFHCNLSENRCFFEMPYLESGNEIYEFDPLSSRVYPSAEFVATQEEYNGAYSNDFTYLGKGVMLVLQGTGNFFLWNKNEPFGEKFLNHLDEKSAFMDNLTDPDNGTQLFIWDNFILNDPVTGLAIAVISAMDDLNKFAFESRFIVMNSSGDYTFLPQYATTIHGVFDNQIIFSGTGVGSFLSLDYKEVLSVNLYSMDILSGTVDIITEEKLHNVEGLESDHAYFLNEQNNFSDSKTTVIVGKAGVFYEIVVDGIPQIVMGKRKTEGMKSFWQNILLQDLVGKSSVINSKGYHYRLTSFLPLTTDVIIADIFGPYFSGSIIAHSSENAVTLYDTLDNVFLPRDYASIQEKLDTTVYKKTKVKNKNFEINGMVRDHIFDVHGFMSTETEKKYVQAKEKGVNANIPIIINIYGGFGRATMEQVTLTNGMYEWIQKGGAIFFAGIAGGGDNGGSGHFSGVNSHRMNAINDIEAVAQALTNSLGFTSYEHMGFVGDSNGGYVGGLTYLLKKNIFKAYSLQAGIYNLGEIKNPSWEFDFGPLLTEKIEMDAWSLMAKEGPNISSAILLQHSLWDGVVPYQQSYNFAKKIADFSGKVFLLTYEMEKVTNEDIKGHFAYTTLSTLDFFTKELMPQ